uniref:BZIP domain-containing protein n=1 Tax=Caenorhabditis japonica TaxID=281687 RepID=A0A8R1ISR5_CAEJA
MSNRKFFEEISKECEHLLKESDCDRCKVQHEDGNEEAIPINDLVDIVMKTVDTMKNNDSSQEETKLLSRKREQNKVAAARYRDKQKAKWQELLSLRTDEEKRNVRLKGQVSKLEKEVNELKAKLLSSAFKK